MTGSCVDKKYCAKELTSVQMAEKNLQKCFETELLKAVPHYMLINVSKTFSVRPTNFRSVTSQHHMPSMNVR